jgi:hypothetical protein
MANISLHQTLVPSPPVITHALPVLQRHVCVRDTVDALPFHGPEAAIAELVAFALEVFAFCPGVAVVAKALVAAVDCGVWYAVVALVGRWAGAGLTGMMAFAAVERAVLEHPVWMALAETILIPERIPDALIAVVLRRSCTAICADCMTCASEPTVGPSPVGIANAGTGCISRRMFNTRQTLSVTRRATACTVCATLPIVYRTVTPDPVQITGAGRYVNW